MCGRYYRLGSKQAIAEHFQLRDGFDGVSMPDADYNVAPNSTQPVIRTNKETGARELVMMRWGIVPNFTFSSMALLLSTFNVKAETMMSTAIWKLNFIRRRCLVPASGFYEWKKLKTKGKEPWRYHLANAHMFAFAGLWDSWKDPTHDNLWLQSYTIITTEPNELIAPVHNRMPVILHPRDYDRWLNRNTAGQDDLPFDLLRTFLSDEMEAFLANPAVGNVRNNSPELLNGKGPWNLPKIVAMRRHRSPASKVPTDNDDRLFTCHP